MWGGGTSWPEHREITRRPPSPPPEMVSGDCECWKPSARSTAIKLEEILLLLDEVTLPGRHGCEVILGATEDLRTQNKYRRLRVCVRTRVGGRVHACT